MSRRCDLPRSAPRRRRVQSISISDREPRVGVAPRPFKLDSRLIHQRRHTELVRSHFASSPRPKSTPECPRDLPVESPSLRANALRGQIREAEWSAQGDGSRLRENTQATRSPDFATRPDGSRETRDPRAVEVGRQGRGLLAEGAPAEAQARARGQVSLEVRGDREVVRAQDGSLRDCFEVEALATRLEATRAPRAGVRARQAVGVARTP